MVRLYRHGGFYDTTDTEALEKVGIRATVKNGVRLAGFPVHALDIVLAKLIRLNYSVCLYQNGALIERISPFKGKD